MKPQSNSVLKIASLFSGCGGFDLGFEQAGFNCVAGFDNDFIATETFNNYFGQKSFVCDLTKSILPTGPIKNLDVLLAGPPCQGFSTIGKREVKDPRNQLVLVAGQIAVACRPKVVVVENVAGVTAGKHKVYWMELQAILRAAGYKTIDMICQAATLGVAQLRKRRILLAWLSPKQFTIQLPTLPPINLQDVLKDISGSNHNVLMMDETSDATQIAERIRPGQKLSNVRGGPRSIHTWDIPEVFGCVSEEERLILQTILILRRQNRIRDFGDADPVAYSAIASALNFDIDTALYSLQEKLYLRKVGDLYDLSQTFNGTYKRLEWHKPSYTVDTRFGQPRSFLHPSENRGFTVREAARVQGFPDHFEFLGSLDAQYRLVGNAVPPPMAQQIARVIRQAVFER